METEPYDVIPTERPLAEDGRLWPYGLRRCSEPEQPETQVILPEHTGKSSARDRKDPVPDSTPLLGPRPFEDPMMSPRP